jgi:cellulose synthase/poly-beta-1,6-N-acetylglucosamine synthase-like glycosyltransferase
MASAVLRLLTGGLAATGVTASPPPVPLRLPTLGPLDVTLIDVMRSAGTVPPSVVAGARTGRLLRGVPLQDTVLAAGVEEETWLDIAAQALGWGRCVGPLAADPRLIDILGAPFCLSNDIVPLARPGTSVVLATARPVEAAAMTGRLSRAFGQPVHFVLAPAEAIEAAVLDLRRMPLADRAEATVPASESCRGWNEAQLRRFGLALVAVLATLGVLAPVTMLAFATGAVLLMLVATTLLKMAALFAALAGRREAAVTFRPRQRGGDLQPFVSILVPLFREREIAERLVRRLWALNWPRERLEICLVLEEEDDVTRAALTRTPLPPWFRLIEVPRGSVKTKPRALNFALPFCRGEIVGIYDAEDAPDPDQIDRVVERFATAPPEVACLQGALDFYNVRDGWLTRCFTIEYASWFRVVLPGLARLGLVVPLGGTTLFFRRGALEQLGAWDAHNVTEDADLGLRLARHGLRTELIATTTTEEANGRYWPWVRQRSRWLKGYAMTWATHMRRPLRLLRDLGWWRFLGVQVLFLGAVIPYAGAPLLWSFWAVPLGLGHPLAPMLGPVGMALATLLFLGCEVANLTVGIIACRLARHPGLAWWTPTMHLYFPLGTIAAWKGLTEIATRPYYWDKTSHGFTHETAENDPPALPSHRT